MPRIGAGERAKWKSLWMAAFSNVPHRTRYYDVATWTPVRGHLTVAEFILKRRDGDLTLHNGVLCFRTTVRMESHYGKWPVIARILGYLTFRGGRKGYSPDGNRVYQNLHRGTRPTAQKIRVELIKLAGLDGKSYALRRMKELGLDMSKYKF